MSIRSRAVAVGVAAWAALPAGGPAGAAAPPPCHAVAFSPGYARDSTAFCYWSDAVPTPRVRFFVTTDRARTWRENPARGLPVSPGTAYEQLIVSPLFAEDRSVFLSASNGLHRSTDLGATFTLVSPLVANLGRDNLTEVAADAAPPVAGRRVTFAYGDPIRDVPLRIDPPAHVPVAGSPDRDLRFLFPPDHAGTGRAFVLADRQEPGAGRRGVLHRCDAALVCADELWRFPAGQVVQEAYFAPDFATARRMWVVTEDVDSHQHLWVSGDAGASFVEDPATVALARAVRAVDGLGIRVGLGIVDAHRVVLAWSFTPALSARANAAGAPRANQVFRSVDGGRRWTRVAYSSGSRQAGPHGTLPWNERLPSAGSYRVFAPMRGVLVLLGARTDTYLGLYCSRDEGRTWRPGCA